MIYLSFPDCGEGGRRGERLAFAAVAGRGQAAQRMPRDWKAVRRSHALRTNATPPERRLWYRLNRQQLDGLKFRRQTAIGPYIADFLCHAARLVIELDGDTHGEDSQIARDDRRTAFLAAQGFRVIRFWNSEIRDDIDDVVRRIRLACGLAEFPAA